MLPKERRIRKAQARELFAAGLGQHSVSFVLKASKSPTPTSPSRFAVSISKKVAPTAVLRNRTRRRVYSALRELVPNVKPGFLVAFSVKKGGEKLSFEKIGPEIKALLARAGLLS